MTYQKEKEAVKSIVRTRSFYRNQQQLESIEQKDKPIKQNQKKEKPTIKKENTMHNFENEKEKRRQKEALDELNELGDISALIVNDCTKRMRNPAKHPDEDYVYAFYLQKLDAGKRGGLIAGSGYHYDRGYNGWN
jgi:hypothetical protein